MVGVVFSSVSDIGKGVKKLFGGRQSRDIVIDRKYISQNAVYIFDIESGRF